MLKPGMYRTRIGRIVIVGQTDLGWLYSYWNDTLYWWYPTGQHVCCSDLDLIK